MITAILSLKYVNGAGIWLAYWFVCAALYLAVCFAKRKNRIGRGAKRVFVGFIVAEAVIDLVWALVFYHSGSYTNLGIGVSALVLSLWFLVLVFAAILVSVINSKKEA